jgi:hypothetical protein
MENAKQIEQVVANLTAAFGQIKAAVRVNGWQPTKARDVWHFRGADYGVVADSPMGPFEYVMAPGLVAYLRPEAEPAIGQMKRIDIRRGSPAALLALVTTLAMEINAGPAGSRPGELPAGNKLARDPSPESGFRRHATAGATAGNPATAPAKPSVSADSPVLGRVTGNDKAASGEGSK